MAKVKYDWVDKYIVCFVQTVLPDGEETLESMDIGEVADILDEMKKKQVNRNV